MTRPEYKANAERPKVTRQQLRHYVREHFQQWQEEYKQNYIGPITRQIQRMARQVNEPTGIRGEER